MYSDTIVAQCTPTGVGALALIRISGLHACINIGKNIARLSSGKSISEVPSHTIHHGCVIDKNNMIIDEVMFFIMHAPRTFTGEHTVEISCHNNSFIIENIIARCIEAGARLAQPGEFSRQAIENGKINILQAEAIKELIHAQTQTALKLSLQQTKGSFSAYLQTLEKPLLEAIALCEASFEFLEEDVSFYNQINDLLTTIQKNIATLIESFNQQKQIREGIRIALIGSVNAGKSSLFNALIGKKRAIVTNIAGTTRDSIEYGIYEEGHYLTIVDTAGLRTTDDAIEQEGINRSYHEAQIADIILLVIDGSNDDAQIGENNFYTHIQTTYANKCITVINKFDLLDSTKVTSMADTFYVSAHTGHNIALLKQHTISKIIDLFKTTTAFPFLLNKRHYGLLIACRNELLEAHMILTQKAEYELISLHLQKALSLITELSGKSITQNTMDAIFRDFCVGK